MWVYALSAPFAGQVGDSFNRKRVILAGLYVWSIITGFTAGCSRLWHFIFIRGAEGLGETFYFPASMSLISDYHSKATRSRAMSIHQTSVYAGTIGGSALAGWMGMHWGWRSPFILLGGLGIILGLVLYTFIREPLRNEAEIAEGGENENAAQTESISFKDFLRQLSQTPSVLLLILAFFGANGVAFVFITWMPTFLREKYDLDLAMAGLNGALFLQVPSMLGSIVGGYLADRWRQRFSGGRMLVQAAGAFIGAPFIFLCGYTQDVTMLYFGMTCFGFSKGIYDANIWASMYDVVAPARRATTLGIANMVGWLSAGLGATATGALVDAGMSMSHVLSSTAVIYVVIGILLSTAGVFLAPRDIRRAAETKSQP
jgi:MFS family permease